MRFNKPQIGIHLRLRRSRKAVKNEAGEAWEDFALKESTVLDSSAKPSPASPASFFTAVVFFEEGE